MEEGEIMSEVVTALISLNYDGLDEMVEHREEIGPGTKDNIKTLKEYIQSIISNKQDAENSLQFYKQVIGDLGNRSDLPANYLDSDILVSQTSRNDIRPLFEKVTKVNKTLQKIQMKCKESEEENKKLNSNQKYIDKNMKLMEDQMEMARLKCQQLQQENDMLKKQQTELNMELEQKNQTITLHKKEVEQLKKKVLSTVELKNEEKNKFQKTIAGLEQLVKKKEEEIERYYEIEESVRERDNRIAELETHIESFNSRSSLSNQTIEQCTKVFIRSNSLVSSLGLNENYSTLLLQKIKEETGKTVKGMESLYNYSIQKKDNFHDFVDKKENILLICLTEEKEIVGGFTSSGFSLAAEDEKVKGFLFNLRNNEMSIFRLKKGRKCTKYDGEYLLFGNQELTIEKGSNQLSSYLVRGSSKQLHFQGSKEAQQTFLSMVQGKHEVKLQNYEIVQVVFEQ